MPIYFHDMFTQYVMSSLDKQLRLADKLGEGSWSSDLRKGTITFEDVGSYEVQILGTEADGSETWLWGWANTASNLPDSLLQVCEKLRQYGEQHSITQLTIAKQPLDDVNGHVVGMIASGFAKSQAYYRCPYDGGALFVLITDPTLNPNSRKRYCSCQHSYQSSD